MKKFILIFAFFVFDFYSQAQSIPAGASQTPTLWVKANSGVTDTGTLTWADQSGTSNNLFQSATAKKPLTNDRLFNYNPAFTFDGLFIVFFNFLIYLS